MTLFSAVPDATGLYDPSFERDACGVAFVASMTGVPSNEIVTHAITSLRNLDHRGASGAEPDSGDGAGILLQVPDEFLRAVVGFDYGLHNRGCNRCFIVAAEICCHGLSGKVWFLSNHEL